MTKFSAFFGAQTVATRALLILATAAAVLFGLYGRFKGIGMWPLGVDEFYISRSIDHVLEGGLPAFSCGGYYTRGLIFQYIVAALRLTGLSPEFAGRLVAGACSVAVLPAAYFLGARLRGPLTGWIAVIILCLSIWEIEMARFGRMYAPFQAVFVCYLLFYLRYTVDKEASALRWMVALSILGIMTWEGGTLMGLANLFAVIQLHHQGRLKPKQWVSVGGLLIVLGLLVIASRDLRGPAGSLVEEAAPAAAPGTLQLLLGEMATVAAHPYWIILYLVPLGLAVMSLRFVYAHRSQWMTAAGLAVVWLAALAHIFTAAFGVLALLLLLRLIDWRALSSRDGRRFMLALAALLLYWLVYYLPPGPHTLEALFGFPDVLQRIARPWARTMPLVTVGMVLALGYWFVESVKADGRAGDPVRTLVGLLIFLGLAVASIPTDRIETRYTFFLYPLLVLLAVEAVLDILERSRRAPSPGWVLAAIPLLCFGATEDLQVEQVAKIDSAAMNYRLGMSDARADHYYPRNDMRGIAQWLTMHRQPGDLVISGIPNLDQYYPAFDYFYLEEDDNRYDAYVCLDGRTERWSNHPVLYTFDSLKPLVGSGHPIYLSVYPDVEARLRSSALALGWSVTRVYTAADDKTAILSVAAM